MKRARAWSLRTQLAGAMAACVLATVLIGYGGLTLLGELQTRYFIAQLPPAAKQARDVIEAGRVPDLAQLKELQDASAEIIPLLNAGQNWGLLVLSVIAVGAGVTASLFLTARIARPLESVAAAARRISQGELGARASASSAAGEISELIVDFNHMAGNLEAAEAELQASSAAIAHELRTPLTILRGRLQGMRDQVFPSAPEDIDRLIQQVEQLSRIVADLQTVSLVATGSLQLDPAPINLADELEWAISVTASDIEAAGMSLELDLRPALVNADPVRIRQAALALLTNARVHAAAGRALRVETFAHQGEGRLRVLDRGPGLPEGDRSRVFERFWQGDVSRARSEGAGLGLSVVRAIAKLHGGRAEAFPREGGGAVFELALPSA